MWIGLINEYAVIDVNEKALHATAATITYLFSDADAENWLVQNLHLANLVLKFVGKIKKKSAIIEKS